MSKIIIVIIICMSILLGIGIYGRLNSDIDTNKEEVITTIEPSATPIATPTPVATYDTTSLDSLLLLANKTHALPSDYEPSDLVLPQVRGDKDGLYLREEAAKAIEELFYDATNDGVNLLLVSAYRSYSYQETLFNGYVSRDGLAEAEIKSSRPGHSDHQTGLAADICRDGCRLNATFADTTEGQWLANNAYKYGFILRYPKGKEDITGYMYEPWHFRYIGKEEAQKVYDSGLCFEEYYNVID